MWLIRVCMQQGETVCSCRILQRLCSCSRMENVSAVCGNFFFLPQMCSVNHRPQEGADVPVSRRSVWRGHFSDCGCHACAKYLLNTLIFHFSQFHLHISIYKVNNESQSKLQLLRGTKLSKQTLIHISCANYFVIMTTVIAVHSLPSLSWKKWRIFWFLNKE